MSEDFIVEHWPFDGEPSGALEQWLGDAFESWIPSRRQLVIHTPDGEQTVSEREWISRTAPGEYRVQARIF